MAEKGVVFTAESIQAILAGTKTQTRRVVGLPERMTGRIVGENGNDENPLGVMYGGGIKRPYCQIGDIIWVRETHGKTIIGDYLYKSDYPYNRELLIDRKWRSPRYMPKEAARIFLRVTDVRVERLQQISEADAIAEGMDSVESYRKHWGEINGKREKGAYKWENDPFLWVYSFERVGEQNAD